ncbi:Hint domain-containing protein [Ruegeria pomeroyi]|uniref:Hint domain-containing protein n=1 Tax=Ruegeria pomeroyi TaxID=89184 RepID=UPI001F15C835|nr:Hint domain-containing protein [Ruegeria pomeroyi]MCE8510943.1 Hint domain-containing protein [Ruegeria pomeroyi]
MVVIRNGSFETGSYQDAGNTGFRTVDSTSDDQFLPDWDVNLAVDVIGSQFHTDRDPDSLGATDGNYAIDLNAYSLGSISQTLDTSAEVGQTIRFAIDIRENPLGGQGGETARVLINGTALVPVSPAQTSSIIDPGSDTGWVTYVFEFVATGSDVLRIDSLGVSDTGGAYLDNVRIVCFVRGTQIQTAQGERAVEQLRPGDRILTMTGEFKPLLWVGSQTVSGKLMSDQSGKAPVRIEPGSLGVGLPRRSLRLSQQHRILLSSRIVERVTGQPEALAAVKHLTAFDGIYVEPVENEVEYFHLLFASHEIVFAEGAPCESLYLGSEACKSFSSEKLMEIKSFFDWDPLEEPKPKSFVPARPFLKGSVVKQVVRRHLKNKVHLVSNAIVRDIALPKERMHA